MSKSEHTPISRIEEIDGLLNAYAQGWMGNWPALDADDKKHLAELKAERASIIKARGETSKTEAA